MLDAWEGIDGTVDVEELGVVGIEVRTDLRMDAAGTSAFLTGVLIAASHTVHICRGASEVGEIAFEVRHLDDLPHLAEDALLRAAGDELALMGGDGAEGTASEAAAMDVDAELDHLVGWDALALVFRMGLTGVGKVEGGVELCGGHRGEGRIDDGRPATYFLQEALGVEHIRLLLDVAEVFGLGAFVAETFLVAVEHDVVRRRLDVGRKIDGLRQVCDVADGLTLAETTREFEGGFLAHTVGDHIGP